MRAPEDRIGRTSRLVRRSFSTVTSSMCSNSSSAAHCRASARLDAVRDATGAGDVVLADAENTPLAVLRRPDGDRPAIEALRPMARGSGLAWDPAVRRSARDVRADLERRGSVDRVVALVIDDLPTRTDAAAVEGLVASSSATAVLFVVPVARRSSQRPAGDPGLRIAARGPGPRPDDRGIASGDADQPARHAVASR